MIEVDQIPFKYLHVGDKKIKYRHKINNQLKYQRKLSRNDCDDMTVVQIPLREQKEELCVLVFKVLHVINL